MLSGCEKRVCVTSQSKGPMARKKAALKPPCEAHATVRT
ncbi:hypothetical protein Agau_C102049 [Agrobacterium tumefaciens F2]|nr:hypothetical protein Agau_C102049 [Agrobacterium tumefaciens F2]